MIQSLHRYSILRLHRVRLTDALLVAAILGVLYAEFLRQFLPSSIGGLIQHGVVMGTFAVVITRGIIQKTLPHSALIWLLVLASSLGLLSILGSHSRGIPTDLISTVLLVKLGYIACIAAVLGPDRLARLIPILSMVQVMGLFVNLAFPDQIATMIPQVYGWLDRSDLVGFQLNVNRFGILAALLFTWYCFLRPDPLLATLMLICLVMSGSRSGVLMLILFVGYFSVRGSNRNITVSLIAFVFACLPIGFLLRDALMLGVEFMRQSLMVETGYIRTIMLMHGSKLAVENFPFGTGGGTFGSPLSLGSAVYHEIGIAQLPTVLEGHGINDSGIGSLLGEYGLLGFALVSICVVQLLKTVAPDRISGADQIFLLIVFLMGSLFRAMISSYYYAALMIFIVVMLAVHRPGEKRQKAYAA